MNASPSLSVLYRHSPITIESVAVTAPQTNKMEIRVVEGDTFESC